MSYKQSDSICIYYPSKDSEMCGKYSINNNCFCKEHEQFINNLQNYIKIDRKYTTNAIKNMLKKIEETKEKIKKGKIAEEIFTLLTKHRKFLSLNTEFNETVYKKLIELKQIEDPDIFNANQYIAELYPDKYLEDNDYCCEDDQNETEFVVEL